MTGLKLYVLSVCLCLSVWLSVLSRTVCTLNLTVSQCGVLREGESAESDSGTQHRRTASLLYVRQTYSSVLGSPVVVSHICGSMILEVPSCLAMTKSVQYFTTCGYVL